MSYYDNRDAKVKIMGSLMEKGWKVFGFSPDQSDSMTDYYCPAHWDGIATKNGYVLVIDNNNTRYSGYEVKKYNYSKQTYKATARIEKLEAMMNDAASTENEKASCAALIEKEKEKQGIAPTYTVEEVYPTFAHGNPKSSNWHIEKDGQIIAKGNGAFAVNNYDWKNEKVDREQQKAEKLAKFIAKIEKVLSDSDALKTEIVKVAKTVVKPVEKEDNTINEGDILSFSYHGGFWIVNSVYDRSGKMAVTYELLGSEKRGYQRTKNGKRYYQYLDAINKQMAEGRAKVYTMQEVTEYVEKTVFTKTKREQKASNAVQIESNDFVTEQPKQATETAQTETVNSDTNNEDQATKRQLWALHVATKLNTTNLVISKQKASELISKSKAGNSIIDELKSLLNLETTEEKQQEQKNTVEELEMMADRVIEYTADIMMDWNTVTVKRPETEEEKEDFKNKLSVFLMDNNLPIEELTSYLKINYSELTILLEAMESLIVSTTPKSSEQGKEQDQEQLLAKIDNQIEAAQKKLDLLSGNYLTNTWKRQQEEASRDMKRESLRFDITLLEYLKDKAINNSTTTFEKALLVGSFRDMIHNYSIQKYEYNYPQIDVRYDLNGYYNKEMSKKQKRLHKAGLYNITQLIAAVDEYKAIKTELLKPVNPIIKKIKNLESKVKFSKISGYFPTPQPIVEKLLNYADIRDGEKILEPSAGNGNILDGITAHLKENGLHATLEAIEWNYTLREILELKNYKLVSNDFMEFAKYDYYDKIIMNPPFEKNQDIQHVQQAYKCLKNNGRLIAIMSPHFTFASDTASVNFREWLEGRGYYEKLPEGAFKESGTNVSTVLVVIEKIEEAAAEAI